MPVGTLVISPWRTSTGAWMAAERSSPALPGVPRRGITAPGPRSFTRSTGGSPAALSSPSRRLAMARRPSGGSPCRAISFKKLSKYSMLLLDDWTWF